MKFHDILPAINLKGSIALPGDKSISHRALILSALSCQPTKIYNLPDSEDVNSTVSVLTKLGVKIRRPKLTEAIIYGRGLSSLAAPQEDIYIKESGTTFRILLGLLAGQDFGVRLLAGEQLSKRPMLRVTSLLRQMGALIEARRINSEEYPPVFINGGRLKGITYQMRVASAQVKSAILLAGLYASGETKVIESVKTRDHTERMLKFFKARIKLKGNTTVITRCAGLKSPRNIIIPGDFSSAAFFIVAATLLPDSRLRLKGVNLNPTRTGLLKVLKMMGADISINKLDKGVSSPEPVGDIEIRTSRLKAVRVLDSLIPSLIDELPILMVASSLAKGVTVLEGVGELRFKETDRIRSMSENLNKMGGDVRIVKKGIKESVVIRGVRELKPAFLKSFSDHRTAMSLVVAASCLRSKSRIEDLSCINKSFPGFLTLFKSLSGEV